MYLGPLTMSFVIPCRNKRALNRLVDKCFLSWKQQCGTSIISLEKKGCCGGTWIEKIANGMESQQGHTTSTSVLRALKRLRGVSIFMSGVVGVTVLSGGC